MSDNKAPLAAKAGFSVGTKILIAVVVIGLGVLHIVGDAVFHSPAIAAKAETVGSNNYGD